MLKDQEGERGLVKPRPLLYLAGRGVQKLIFQKLNDTPTCRARLWKQSDRSLGSRSHHSWQSRHLSFPQTEARSRLRPCNQRSDKEGLSCKKLRQDNRVQTFRFSSASWTSLESLQFALVSSKSGSYRGTTSHTATLSTSVSFDSASSSTMSLPHFHAPSQSFPVRHARTTGSTWSMPWPRSSTAASTSSSSNCFFTRQSTRRESSTGDRFNRS